MDKPISTGAAISPGPCGVMGTARFAVSEAKYSPVEVPPGDETADMYTAGAAAGVAPRRRRVTMNHPSRASSNTPTTVTPAAMPALAPSEIPAASVGAGAGLVAAGTPPGSEQPACPDAQRVADTDSVLLVAE